MLEQNIQEQMALAVVVTHGVEWMKRSGWFPWVTVESKTLIRVLGAVGAFVSAAGVQWTLNGTLTAGGQILLSWPPAEQMFGVLIEQMFGVLSTAVSSWAMQQVFYQTTIKSTPTELFFTRRPSVTQDSKPQEKGS